MCRASGKYMQIFAPSDEVMIQVITRSESRPITGKVINIVTGHETVIDWQIWSMNHTDKIYYHVLTALAEGCYRIDINGMVSEPFRITSDTSELSRTTLIQYSMRTTDKGRMLSFGFPTLSISLTGVLPAVSWMTTGYSV